MVCPHCKYESTWNEVGEDEGFYTISNDIKMERDYSGDIEECFVFGCPKCKKVFID